MPHKLEASWPPKNQPAAQGLYCPPLIPARIRRNPVNSRNSIGIKFGRGACQIHTMIPTESWIKFKFHQNGSRNHLDGMHRNRICSYNVYNALNPTSPLPPSLSTTTIQHTASPLSPMATTIHGLHPLPSTMSPHDGPTRQREWGG